VNTRFSEPIAFAVECHQKGAFEEAEKVYRELLAENPENPDAMHLLGMLAHDTGSPETALGYIARAIQLRPHVPYYHSNLGNVFQRLGRYQDAELCYQEALRLQPGMPVAYNNLGNALNAMKRFPEATHSFLEAIRLKPDYHEAFGNLANMLVGQGSWKEAAACYEEAHRLRPDDTRYAAGLVNVLEKSAGEWAQQGNHALAIACYGAALEVWPEDPELHLRLSHSLLVTGQLVSGWEELEWRWRIKDHPNVSFAQPVWDGAPIPGKRILLWAEQGSGDTIQFVRFAADAKRAGGTVLVECQPSLERLLRTCAGVDEVIPFGSPLPDFDLHAPLQSLPRIVRTTLETIPKQVPYLSAGAAAGALEPGSVMLRVGLAWAGNPQNQNDARRSMRPEQFLALKQIPGIEWCSLQKEDVAGDFLDAAGLIANLDLVISVDTAAAHLAGALGKPVWTLLAFAADSRWLLDREDSPWYPGMRLFRQSEPGEWDPVLTRVGEALEDFRNGCRR
jgi:tetratricopeptide (TPR) repeat protein